MSHKEIYKLTLSAIFCALSLVLLIVGVIPGFFYVGIYLAISVLNYILKYTGFKYWILCYITVSILCFLLVPNLDVTATFIYMGIYPIFKNLIEKYTKHKKTLKFIVMLICSYVMYYVAIWIFGFEAINAMGLSFYWVIYTLITLCTYWILEYCLIVCERRIYPRITKAVEKYMK